MKTLSSLTRPHSRMCIRMYIFCFKQTNKQRKKQKQKAKETKANRKAKETNEEREKENVVVNNICEKCNKIRWYNLTICSVYF